MVVLVCRYGGTRAVYTSASFSGQSDFAFQKSCTCVTLVSQNPPVLLPQKSICRHTLPCCRARRQPLSRVSRKQRYNTLDFAKQNRVPTGMLRAPIGNPASKEIAPLCTPHIFFAASTQTVKIAVWRHCSENTKATVTFIIHEDENYSGFS